MLRRRQLGEQLTGRPLEFRPRRSALDRTERQCRHCLRSHLREHRLPPFAAIGDRCSHRRRHRRSGLRLTARIMDTATSSTTSCTGSTGHTGDHHVEHVMGTAVSFDVRDAAADRGGLAEAVAWLHHVDQTLSTYIQLRVKSSEESVNRLKSDGVRHDEQMNRFPRAFRSHSFARSALGPAVEGASFCLRPRHPGSPDRPTIDGEGGARIGPFPPDVRPDRTRFAAGLPTRSLRLRWRCGSRRATSR